MRLAAKLDVSYQQVQKYEKGVSSISVERLESIAQALNVPITTFLPGVAKEGVSARMTAPPIADDERAILDVYRKLKGRSARRAFFEILTLLIKSRPLLRKL